MAGPARDSLDPPFARLGIVGLGLIGGSVALAARRRWPDIEITGVDNPEVIQAAMDGRLIQSHAAGPAELTSVDLVVLAAPIDGILEGLAAAGRATLPGAITDVGSTKRQIMAAAAAAGLTDFVGGHPMAGAERGGLAHARADLFDGRPWFIEPGQAGAAVVERVEQWVTGLGAAPRTVDAVSHDRTMAYASHLPQLLASSLMATAGSTLGADGLSVSGTALREMTRLASSPPDVWRGILTTNADYISEALAAFTATLPATAPLDVVKWIDEVFRQARVWRDRLEHPTPPVN